jgi:hypothetical protein
MFHHDLLQRFVPGEINPVVPFQKFIAIEQKFWDNRRLQGESQGFDADPKEFLSFSFCKSKSDSHGQSSF